MRVVRKTKVMTDAEIRSKRGTFFHEYESLYNESVCIEDENGQILACFLKNVIPEDVCRVARDVYETVGDRKSINRGDASGTDGDTKQSRAMDFTANRLYEQDTRVVRSGIMGYMDSANWRSPCRQTAFNAAHQDAFDKGKPYIEMISVLYKQHLPDAYNKQEAASLKSPNHIISNTVFSTVTVNKNFQTALHIDRGDFIGGYGNISVVERGSYRGGYTVIPQYGVGFDVRQGDVLFLDVHRYHCNTPIEPLTPDAMRLSFVCYLRRNMYKCDDIEPMISCQQHLDTNQKIWHMLTGDPASDIPESLPPNATRTSLGKGSFGHSWYLVESPYARIRYHNKRYTATLRKQDPDTGEWHETSYDAYGCITKSYYDFVKDIRRQTHPDNFSDVYS